MAWGIKKSKKDKSDEIQVQKNKYNTALLEHISPIALDFHTRDMVFGERFARGLVIVSYPTKVNTAWLSLIAAMPGVVCSIHVVPNMDKDELIKAINRSIGEHKARLAKAHNAFMEQEAENAVTDAYELIQKLREEQNVFYMVVTLLITASDQEGLDRKTRQVQSTLSSFSMKGRIAIHEQEQVLKANGPWGILPEEIFLMGKRNMPSETVAASFPFVSTSMNDGNGIILGRTRVGRSRKAGGGGLVILDIWNKGGDRPNSNWIVLAMPGSGKSFTIKLLCLREYIRGTKVIMVDPEREDKVLCELLGGSWINAGGGNYRINPLQVRSNESSDEEDECGHSPLALHIQKVRTFLKLYLQEISMVEEKYLMKAVQETYFNKGITFETDPNKIQNEDWPTIKDLWENLSIRAKDDPQGPWEKLSMFLEDAAVGVDSSLWAGVTTIKTESDFIVLDIYDLENASENVKRAQYFNILTWAWDQVKKDRKEEVILVVDEAWLLVDPKCPEAIEFLRNTSKRIRKYEGSLIVISQNIRDFMDPAVARYGEAIFNNSTYKLLLGQGEKDLEVIHRLMHLSEAETDLLMNVPRGEGLLVAGREKIHLKIEAADYELPYLIGGGR